MDATSAAQVLTVRGDRGEGAELTDTHLLVSGGRVVGLLWAREGRHRRLQLERAQRTLSDLDREGGEWNMPAEDRRRTEPPGGKARGRMEPSVEWGAGVSSPRREC